MTFRYVDAASQIRSASFADFDRRARDGACLNVVFFGASLTYGANSSDPEATSYRAGIARRMAAEYPCARFRYTDASIGGTTSQLGAFRFERDVLSRRPDLVFLDFSLNDGMYSCDPETLASYESLVRRCIIDARTPVVQVIFPSRGMAEQGHTRDMAGRDAHLAISAAYGTGVGDAVSYIQQQLRLGRISANDLWPFAHDKTHPGDLGYALYAEAAWRGFQEAVQEKRVCTVSRERLHSGIYDAPLRLPLSSLAPLPPEWRIGSPNTLSSHYDMLMSRWLDSEVVITPCGRRGPGTLAAEFTGGTILVFGESTLQSGSFRATIETHVSGRPVTLEKLVDASQVARFVGGNAHLVAVLASGLEQKLVHRLEIAPVLEEGQELRLESLCIAGKAPQLELAGIEADAPLALNGQLV